MSVTGLCHFNLRASREVIEKLRTFYCDVVGLRVGERPAFRSFGYWLYAGGKDVLHLSVATTDEPRSADAASLPGVFDHVAFRCSERAAVEARLHAHGIRFRSNRVPDTGQFQLFFEDPAGTGIELNFCD